MSARANLVARVMDAIIYDNWLDDEEMAACRVQANKEVDEFAHELAEQIRREGRDWDGWPDHVNSMNIAANLIDPEVGNG